MKLNLVSTTSTNSTVTVSDEVFAAKPNKIVLSQAVRVYLANQRQGTSKTKTRSEINRSKKKWFKQKGTGNARHGARTPNIFVGGGVSHGPTGLENWKLSLSVAVRRLAMRLALSAQAGSIVVSEEIGELRAKTAVAAKLVKGLTGGSKRVLVILPKTVPNVVRALRNIETVLVMTASRVSLLEVVYADRIIIAKDALTVLEDRLLGKVNAKPTVSQSDEVAMFVAKKVEKKPAKKAAAKTAKKEVKKTTAKSVKKAK
ncbi:MAG: 50S ribosomal protein L4 [Patescibacteria group bacterium]